MITILRSGTYLSLVDKGRFGYQKYGVPVSGAMDRHSATVANVLLGNNDESALLELYMPGHRLQFSKNTKIAITGADATVYLGDELVDINKAVIAEEGAILSIGNFQNGAYLYLAVEGGFKNKAILGSRSPMSNLYGRQLRTDDTLDTYQDKSPALSNTHIAPIRIDPDTKIRCAPGPEWYLMNDNTRATIIANDYSISQQSNRMGYRLNGKPVNQEYQDIYSSPVMPGTVQLLPSGVPLILMRDCQTTGGYPRILQITPDCINQAAQRRPGQKIQFDVINGK